MNLSQFLMPAVWYAMVMVIAAGFLLMRDETMKPRKVLMLALFWPLTVILGVPYICGRWAFSELLRILTRGRGMAPAADRYGARLTSIEKDISEMKAMTLWLLRRSESTNGNRPLSV